MLSGVLAEQYIHGLQLQSLDIAERSWVIYIRQKLYIVVVRILETIGESHIKTSQLRRLLLLHPIRLFQGLRQKRRGLSEIACPGPLQ